MPSVKLFMVPWPQARPKAFSTRSATREEVSTLPAATAAGGARVEQRPVFGDDLDRPVRARAGRDVGVGEHAHGKEAGAARDGQRAVEVARILGGAAAEVEDQPVAVDGRGDAQFEVAVDALQDVDRVARAVGKLAQAGARAALGVVEDRGAGVAQAVGAEPLRQLAHAGRAEAVGGQLGAQVGAPLGRLAHLPGQLLDRRVVEHARRDDDALLVERARVEGHRAGHAPADVGVVGAAGREPQQRRSRRRGPG